MEKIKDLLSLAFSKYIFCFENPLPLCLLCLKYFNGSHYNRFLLQSYTGDPACCRVKRKEKSNFTQIFVALDPFSACNPGYHIFSLSTFQRSKKYQNTAVFQKGIYHCLTIYLLQVQVTPVNFLLSYQSVISHVRHIRQLSNQCQVQIDKL